MQGLVATCDMQQDGMRQLQLAHNCTAEPVQASWRSRPSGANTLPAKDVSSSTHAVYRCYRRGVGPKPIAIDSLTEDKLVAALEFMADSAVKGKAEFIASELAQVMPCWILLDLLRRHGHFPLHPCGGTRALSLQRAVMHQTLSSRREQKRLLLA